MAEPTLLHKGNQYDTHAILELVLHTRDLSKNQLLKVADKSLRQRLVVSFDHAFESEERQLSDFNVEGFSEGELQKAEVVARVFL